MVSLFSQDFFQYIHRQLADKPSGFSGRLLHGRGGTAAGLEDFSADVYGSLLFIVVYRSLTGQERGDMEKILKRLLDEFRDLHEIRSAIVQERSSRGSEIVASAGFPVPEKLTFLEDGLKFFAEPLRGQNPGFFFDARSARSWVREHSRDMRVLNLFAYTCGFSVAAAAGGAGEVVNIDMKQAVLDRGRENHVLNFGDGIPCRVSYLSLDIMKSFSRVDRMGLFDIIIADPPSRQGRSFQYNRDYPKLLRRAGKWLAPHGVLMTLLNAPDAPENWLKSQVKEYIPGLFEGGKVVKGPDFPESSPSREVLGLLWRGAD